MNKEGPKMRAQLKKKYLRKIQVALKNPYNRLHDHYIKAIEILQGVHDVTPQELFIFEKNLQRWFPQEIVELSDSDDEVMEIFNTDALTTRPSNLPLLPRTLNISPLQFVNSPEKQPATTTAAKTPKRPHNEQESLGSYRLKKSNLPPSSVYSKPTTSKNASGFLAAPPKVTNQKKENMDKKIFNEKLEKVKKSIQEKMLKEKDGGMQVNDTERDDDNEFKGLLEEISMPKENNKKGKTKK